MKEYKIFTFHEKCIEKIDHWRQISDKKRYVKKCTPSIWPKSKIPDIQVVQIDICDKLYRRDF